MTGIDKETNGQLRVGVFALVRDIWSENNNLILTRLELFIFYMVSIWLVMDPHVVLSTSGGGQGHMAYGRNPYGDGSTR